MALFASRVLRVESWGATVSRTAPGSTCATRSKQCATSNSRHGGAASSLGGM